MFAVASASGTSLVQQQAVHHLSISHGPLTPTVHDCAGTFSPAAVHVVDESMPVLLRATNADLDKPAVAAALTAAAAFLQGTSALACR